MKSFKKLQISNDILSRFQDNVEEIFRIFTSLPICDGLLLEDVALTTGTTNLVSHGLGRVPRMWIVAGKDAFADIKEVSSPDPVTILALQCDANCTVNLWVA